METWIDDLARALDDEPLSPEDVETLLAIARDVAHRVERRITPLSTFLLGAAVGRREAAGDSRDEALATTLVTLRGILLEAPAR
ncbi:MAG: DUF6457 domain-containing protein [Actinomycetota bacterium]